MFDDSLLDDTTALQRVDPALRHLAEAGARIRREVGASSEQSEDLSPSDQVRAVVAAGRDSRLLRAILEPRCPVPFVAWPGPGLPGWAGALDVVAVLAQAPDDLAATSAVSEAVRRGCELLVTCPEHSSVAELAASRYTTVLPTHSQDALAGAVVLLRALHRLGLGPQVDADEVAASLDAVAARCSPFVDLSNNPAKELAIGIGDCMPLLWGGSVLAARASRRVAEAIRRATGRTAIADAADHLLPILSGTPPHDVFGDPFDDSESGPAGTTRPALIVVDDGTDDQVIREERGRLAATAERQGVRVEIIACDQGSEVSRYATILALGSFMALYTGVALGGPHEDRM